MAAMIRRIAITTIFKLLSSLAIIAPVAKSSESPGRNGVTTSPVSAKIMIKSIKYVQVL